MSLSADPVHTLDDLGRWSHAGTSLAVLGHPIGHSLSPAMHNAALKELAKRDSRFRDWRYFRFDVPPADLPRALELLHEKRFHGLNLTVPHKILAVKSVLAFDEAADFANAVNTLVWTERGWYGHNTDGYGLSTAVHEKFGLKLTDTHVILLGAGGAARGAAVECVKQRCAALWIHNRTHKNFGELRVLLAGISASSGKTPVYELEPNSSFSNLPADTLVINATSVGLNASDASPIDLNKLPHPAGVFDMIYNPPETRLLAQAREMKIPHANGLSMLVHQGAKSLELWTGAPAAETAPIMRAAAEAALRQ